MESYCCYISYTFILGLCMIVRGIDFFLCDDISHSFVFFIKKKFLVLLKPFKKFIKWMLTFCKKGICWLLKRVFAGY